MLRQLLVRSGRALLTAWLIASALFLLSHSLQSSTPQLLSDERQQAFGRYQATEQQYRQRLGLQQPLFYFGLLPGRWHGTPNQYHAWLSSLLRGRLGVSYRDGVVVETQLAAALTVTLPLTGSALLLSAALTLPLALWAAQRPQFFSRITTAAYFLDGLPLFVVSMVLLLLLASPDFWPLFPAYGWQSPSDSGTAVLPWLDVLWHLALPVTALTLVGLPTLLLPTAAALHAQWQQPYVATARAKGVSINRLQWRHVLPNVLPVFIGRFSDLVPGVVAGAVVVEVVFALPGMGRLLAEAAAARDLPVLIGGVLLIAGVRLLAWVLADFLNSLLDPRLSWS
jgi:peptide/nickel transport system permease protein